MSKIPDLGFDALGLDRAVRGPLFSTTVPPRNISSHLTASCSSATSPTRPGWKSLGVGDSIAEAMCHLADVADEEEASVDAPGHGVGALRESRDGRHLSGTDTCQLIVVCFCIRERELQSAALRRARTADSKCKVFGGSQARDRRKGKGVWRFAP